MRRLMRRTNDSVLTFSSKPCPAASKRSFVRSNACPPCLRADPVTGPYDIVALLAVDEVRDISHTVAGTIGGMRGVTRTTTLICAA